MAENEQLASCGFIRELSEPIQQILLHNMRLKRAKKGEILYYENDEIDKIYFLVSGCVKSYKVTRFDNEVFLFMQKTSGLITCFSLYEEKNRYFSNIESEIDSLVCVMEMSVLRDQLAKYPPLENFFTKQLSAKVGILTHVITRDMVFDSTAKVAYMINHQLSEFNVQKKQDVAYMLNIQPETLSRILKKIKRDGIIDTDPNGNVLVLDRKSLIEIYEQ